MFPRAVGSVLVASLVVCSGCKKPPPSPVEQALSALDARITALGLPESQGEGLTTAPAGIRVLLSGTRIEISGVAALAQAPAAERDAVWQGRGVDAQTLGWIRGRTVALPNLGAQGIEGVAVLVPELRDGLRSLAAWRLQGATEPLPVSIWIGRAVNYRQADVVLGAVARAGYHSVSVGFARGDQREALSIDLPGPCAHPSQAPGRCAVSQIRMLPAGYQVRALAYARDQVGCVPAESALPNPIDMLRPQPTELPTVIPGPGPQVPDGVRNWMGRVMFGPHKECPSVPREAPEPYDARTVAEVARAVTAIAPGCALATVVPGPSTAWGEVALTAEALRGVGQVGVRLGAVDANAAFDCVGAVRPAEVIPER